MITTLALHPNMRNLVLIIAMLTATMGTATAQGSVHMYSPDDFSPEARAARIYPRSTQWRERAVEAERLRRELESHELFNKFMEGATTACVTAWVNGAIYHVCK